MTKMVHDLPLNKRVSLNRWLGQWLGEAISGGTSRNNEDWNLRVLFTLSMLACMSCQILNLSKPFLR